MSGSLIFSLISTAERIAIHKSLSELCPEEFSWAIAEADSADLFKFFEDGCEPQVQNLNKVEAALESCLIALSLGGTSQLSKRQSGLVSCYYLSCFCRTQVDLESVLSPLALGMIVDSRIEIDENYLVSFLYSCISALRIRTKVDPLSLFALAAGLVTHDWQQHVLKVLALHAEDRKRWESKQTHPLLPICPGTSTELGIRMLREQLRIRKSSKEFSDEMNGFLEYFEGR